jgi:hypothetical protein
MNNEKPYHLMLMNQNDLRSKKKSKEQKMKETFIMTKVKTKVNKMKPPGYY